jgi:hypothetical protein
MTSLKHIYSLGNDKGHPPQVVNAKVVGFNISSVASHSSGYLAINTLNHHYKLEPSCLKGLSITFNVPGKCLLDQSSTGMPS